MCDRCSVVVWAEQVRVAGSLMDWRELCEECYGSFIQKEYLRIMEDI
jgi:hypothetical protein